LTVETQRAASLQSGWKNLPARAASAAIAISTTIPAAPATAPWPSTTTAWPSSAAGAAVAALGSRPSFIYCDRASTKVAAVQRLDRRIALTAVGHFDETKSPQTSAELTSNQIHFADCSVFAKSLS
jgi:hypothetical protein